LPQTALLATALACLVLALGCERASKAADAPRNTTERTTTIWAPPPVQQASDLEPVSAPEPPQPEPAMSTPPTNEVLDAPTPSSEPVPAAPRQRPSQYEDGCGRPLVT
jgi:hypothetical protein